MTPTDVPVNQNYNILFNNLDDDNSDIKHTEGLLDTGRTKKQHHGLDLIEEMKDKEAGNRLEKVEQDQPLPTYQRDVIDGEDSDDPNVVFGEDKFLETARA